MLLRTDTHGLPIAAGPALCDIFTNALSLLWIAQPLEDFLATAAGGEFGLEMDPDASGWGNARQQAALDPVGIVAQVRAMVDHYGFGSIKLKGGALEPAVEVRSVLALREEFGPEVPLRLVPKATWKLDTAITWGRKLEGVLEYYEDPVRGLETMGKLGKAIDIPLTTNMCTTSFSDLPGSVRWESESIILSDHHFRGGLRASIELARFCDAFGRGLSMHSNSHVGVSLKAMTHLAAAVPNLTYDLDTHYP